MFEKKVSSITVGINRFWCLIANTLDKPSFLWLCGSESCSIVLLLVVSDVPTVSAIPTFAALYGPLDLLSLTEFEFAASFREFLALFFDFVMTHLILSSNASFP